MRDGWVGGATAAMIAATVGVIVWVAVEMHAWENACKDAGGRVVQSYVGTHIEYIYNDKGQVVGSHPVSDYRYWCSDPSGRENEV